MQMLLEHLKHIDNTNQLRHIMLSGDWIPLPLLKSIQTIFGEQVTITVQPDVKFKRTQKYEPKILVWFAISTRGISLPFFAKQKQAINETIYLNECIIKRLIPFIDDYHHKDKVLFWPDLASSHYSNTVIHYLDDNGIKFVQQHCNPQNYPQSRPIETLWSILKNMVYDQGWEAKNIDQLKQRITQKLKEIDLNVVQTMFLDIRRQLRKITDNGPFATCSS